jgi:hypothetical protein
MKLAAVFLLIALGTPAWGDELADCQPSPSPVDGLGADALVQWYNSLTPEQKAARQAELGASIQCMKRLQERNTADTSKILEVALGTAAGQKIFRQSMTDFEADPNGCASGHLPKALSTARGLVHLGITTKSNGQLVDFGAALDGGTSLLDIADSARKRGCVDQARDAYDDVIRTYVGQAYAGLRQRAEIGLRRIGQ